MIRVRIGLIQSESSLYPGRPRLSERLRMVGKEGSTKPFTLVVILPSRAACNNGNTFGLH